MPNPYLQDQAGQISRGLTQNLNENIMPGINSGAMLAGGFGGSRHGIAQGLGIGRTQQAIGDAQTNLYSTAYNTDQQIASQQAMQQAQLAAQERMFGAQNQTQRDLGFGGLSNQRYGMDQTYGLGLGQLGLNSRVADQNFYTNQRGQDLSQMGLGMQMANQGNLGLSSQGQQLYQSGQQQQQAPWAQLGNFGNLASQFSGLNQTQTQSTPGASTVGSALGGALTAAQLWQLLTGGKP